MKTLTMFSSLLLILLLSNYNCYAQGGRPDYKVFEKYYGADLREPCNFIKTSDGGYLITTLSKGMSYDQTEMFHGKNDIWVLKLNADYQKEWDRQLGGSQYETYVSVLEIPSGYVLFGYSNSPADGNKSQPNHIDPNCSAESYCNTDVWIIQLSHSGTIINDKVFGSSNIEGGIYYFLQNTTMLYRNNFIYVVALSYYNPLSGIAHEHSSIPGNTYGKAHIWLLKLDTQLNKIWDKCYSTANNAIYGGASPESLHTIGDMLLIAYQHGVPVPSGAFSQPTCYTFTYPNLPNDTASLYLEAGYLMVDTNGIKVWDKTFCQGSNINILIPSLLGVQEGLNSYTLKVNDGFILFYTSSRDTGNHKTVSPYSFEEQRADIWMVKFDTAFQIQWQKIIGSICQDNIIKVIQTTDGGYLLQIHLTCFNPADMALAAYEKHDVQPESNPKQAFWLLKLDNIGKYQWDKIIQGATPSSLCIQEDDHCYTVIGSTWDSLGLINSGITINYPNQLVDLSLNGNKALYVIRICDSAYQFINNYPILQYLADFNLYPNPCSRYFKINGPVDLLSSANIYLYNSLGILCKQISQLTNNHHDISDLPDGVYTVEFKTPAGSAMKKLIVLHND